MQIVANNTLKNDKITFNSIDKFFVFSNFPILDHVSVLGTTPKKNISVKLFCNIKIEHICNLNTTFILILIKVAYIEF